MSCSNLRKARFQALPPPRQVLLALPLRRSLRSCLPCSSFLHAIIRILKSRLCSGSRAKQHLSRLPDPYGSTQQHRARHQGSTRSLANCRCRCAIVRRSSATSAALARKSAGL